MRFYFFILNLLFFINASGECELLLKSMLDYGKLYDNSNEVYYIHPLDIYKNQLTLKDGLFYDYKGRPANTRRFFGIPIIFLSWISMVISYSQNQLMALSITLPYQGEMRLLWQEQLF